MKLSECETGTRVRCCEPCDKPREGVILGVYKGRGGLPSEVFVEVKEDGETATYMFSASCCTPA